MPSTERPSTRHTLPVDWLDRLLAIQCSVRAGASLEEDVTVILSGARDLLDEVAVGACIPSAPSTPTSTSDHPLQSAVERQLVIRLALDPSARQVDPDPARLFPELASERVLAIGADGSTLHVACDDEGRLDNSAIAGQLFERVTAMIAAVVDHHRAVARSLQALRAQVIQSEKLASLGQIAAGIVHELNNPLTTIVAYSDFLRKKLTRTGGEQSDVERLARINEAAERILRFSRDLTAYSRPSSEVPAPVAIHDVIDRALVFCEHELDSTGVLVERQFGEVRAVRGVAGQLTQVFVNLFTNAAHAMREGGGMLTITTSMRDDEVEITVSDDGHGIDEEHRERVFEPFFTTKADQSGTGLGLSIVRSIVQSHGGRIRVDGNEPRGTVFCVGLPTAAAPKSDH
ncbi:integral membrane sensor signal transduction histidine kinase [Minicystis rosea]|nr:integral membrane sensor signal transduction histidine kinase [Minicystis rosea]